MYFYILSDDFSEPHSVALPVKFPDTRVKQISCGRSHILVLTDNEGGKHKLIIRCQILLYIFLRCILNFKMSYVLTVFAVGGNSQGQCGIGSTQLLKSFQKLHIPKGENIIKACVSIVQ